MAAPPQQLRLQWDEPISARLSTIQIRDARGQHVEEVWVPPEGPAGKTLIVGLPSLTPGTYSVLWKVLSEADGHVSRGLVVFGVGEQLQYGREAVPSEPDARVAGLEAGLRAAYFLGLLGAIGGCIAGPIILGPAAFGGCLSGGLICTAGRRSLFWASSCSFAAFVAGLTLFGSQLYSLDVGLAAAWPLLSESRWGRLWAAREALLCAGGTLGLLASRNGGGAEGRDKGQARRRAMPGPAAGGMYVCVGMVVVLQALSGHAAALGERVAAPIAADILHIMAGGIWAGGLVGLVAVLSLWRERSRNQVLASALDVFRRFTPVAAISVAVLLVTGIYAVVRQTPRLEGLIESPYGWALAAKLLLVAIMGVLGLCNFALLHRPIVERFAAGSLPGFLRRGLPARGAPRLLRAEALVAVLVVCTVGLLTASPPPRAWTAPKLQDASRAASATVDDLLVTVSVKPNQPGQNVFAILAASTRRPAPAPITRVVLRFTYLDQDAGRVTARANELEPGRYMLIGQQLSTPGRWRIDVVVRRDGLEDSIARFDWLTGGAVAGAMLPTVRSIVPAGVSALFLLLIAGIIVALAVQRRIGAPGRLRREAAESSCSPHSTITHWRPLLRQRVGSSA